MSVHVIALHGFLGTPADWDTVAHLLPGVTVHALDLWKVLAGAHDWASATAAVDRAIAETATSLLAPQTGPGPVLAPETGPGPVRRAIGLGTGPGSMSLPGPVLQGENEAAEEVASGPVPSEETGPGPVSGLETGPGPVFVVGYSMGARLALGSRLLSSPGSGLRGCCFVSCNPGLADDDEAGRAARRESDAAWARRILRDPKEAVWRAWDTQPVFAGSAAPAGRAAFPAPRKVLSRGLTACSLAGQPDLRRRLRDWPGTALWVTGARDPKFAALASDLQQAGTGGEFVTITDAGHRVPWDNPPAFAAVLQEWMTR